jgi:RNA polymerase sigma-70 factor (ECF subfamily)
MTSPDVSDEVLLAGHDAASFALFYRRHVDVLLGFFSRRTRDAEFAADLTAETFATALAARSQYRPEAGAAASWLFTIAMNKLTDAQRRGYAERRAQRRLGMERIELDEQDIARIDALGDNPTVTRWLDGLGPDQREAVRAHVIDERSYEDIATRQHVSQAVVRKRVSRGLAIVRGKIGSRR